MNTLKNEYQRIIESDGPWTAHNIYIENDFYTIKNGVINDEHKLRRVIQNIRDVTKKELNQLKILDLACLEGLFGIECARHGANVTFLDIRESNLRKVEFLAKSLNISNYSIVKDDVRKISLEKYGQFDVILCFGIFYHLDKNDLFDFINRMYEIATEFVFLDTHITESNKEHFLSNNIEYWGKSYREHRSDATTDEIESDLWKSHGNTYSFILTKSSLVRMLQQSGFSSVFESYLPVDRTKNFSRVSFIALKGKPVSIYSAPLVNQSVNEIAPEITNKIIAGQRKLSRKNDLRYFLSMNTPKSIKRLYKKIFRK